VARLAEWHNLCGIRSTSNYTMNWMVRALWLVGCPWSIRGQTHGWRHEKVVFLVLPNMALSFENVCAIIQLCTQEGHTKSFKEAVYSKIKTKSSVDELENANSKKPSNSRALRGKSVVVIAFSCSLYKTDRFHVAVRLFSNRSQKTPKCGKNISDTLGYRLVCHFFVLTTFWRHLWSITEQNWTDARQHGIYLLHRKQWKSQSNSHWDSQ